MYTLRKQACVLLTILGAGILACSFLMLGRGGTFLKQLHGREYLTVQAYNNLIQDIDNISRAVQSVEIQAATLSHDIEELKMSAKNMLLEQQRQKRAIKATDSLQHYNVTPNWHSGR